MTNKFRNIYIFPDIMVSLLGYIHFRLSRRRILSNINHTWAKITMISYLIQTIIGLWRSLLFTLNIMRIFSIPSNLFNSFDSNRLVVLFVHLSSSKEIANNATLESYFCIVGLLNSLTSVIHVLKITLKMPEKRRFCLTKIHTPALYRRKARVSM